MYTTVDQIATEFHRHPMYIRKLARNGVLAAVKVAGEWHIDHDMAAQYFGRHGSSEIVEQAIVEIETAPIAYVMSNRTFGVEIEVVEANHTVVTAALRQAGIEVTDQYSNYNHNDSRTSWKVMSDGSLGSSDSCEVVSPILSGEAGLAELNRVCEALDAAHAKINKKCGLHVHIGTDDLNVQAVKNIVESYENNFTVICRFLSPSRRAGNTYCKPYDPSMRNRLQHCSTIEEMAQVVDGRYHTVNLEAYTRHGTVEFRQHQGTVEYVKISNWVRFVVAMAEFAKRESLNPMNTVQELVASLGLSEETRNYFINREAHFAARAA